jgi:hypothetical protein
MMLSNHSFTTSVSHNGTAGTLGRVRGVNTFGFPHPISVINLRPLLLVTQ